MRVLRLSFLRQYFLLTKNLKKALLIINIGIFLSIFAATSASISFYIEKKINEKEFLLITNQQAQRHLSNASVAFASLTTLMDTLVNNETSRESTSSLFSMTYFGDKVLSNKDFYLPVIFTAKKEIEDYSDFLNEKISYEEDGVTKEADLYEFLLYFIQDWSEEEIKKFKAIIDNVKLTEDSNNSGFDGANNSGDGAFLLIDLGKPKKIEAIQTRGIYEFTVNYSNENELNSFENHIIKNVSASSTSNVFKYSEILPNDETSLGTKNWDNLKNEKNRKPVARYIKITPKSANYKFQMELFTTEADSVSQSSLNIDQIEHDFILYNETDVSDAKIYNLNSSYFKIVFSKNVLVNKLVLYSKPTSKNWITNYNIKYRNSQNNYEKIITNVVGVTGANEQNHFWFPYLILADEITIEPKREKSGNGVSWDEYNRWQRK